MLESVPSAQLPGSSQAPSLAKAQESPGSGGQPSVTTTGRSASAACAPWTHRFDIAGMAPPSSRTNTVAVAPIEVAVAPIEIEGPDRPHEPAREKLHRARVLLEELNEGGDFCVEVAAQRKALLELENGDEVTLIVAHNYGAQNRIPRTCCGSTRPSHRTSGTRTIWTLAPCSPLTGCRRRCASSSCPSEDGGGTSSRDYDDIEVYVIFP